MAPKNLQVSFGGPGPHRTRGWMARLGTAGVETVSVSPLRDDTVDELGARWLPIRPNADTALMLGLAHSLMEEGLHDRAFLERYCTGFERFAAYLDGRADGVAKDAGWASARCDIAAGEIRALARRMGRDADDDYAELLAATRRPGRAADLGGHRARLHAGPDRPAGRRVRHRLRRDGLDRQREDRGRAARAARRQGPDEELHPGRAHRRHAAEPGRRIRFRRRAADLSRYPHGLVGGRQPVPPPPGPQPAAARLAQAGRRSSCRTRSGPRRHATPTSCCRRRRRWRGTISAPAAAIPRSTPCAARSSRWARRGATTTSWPRSPDGWGWRARSRTARASSTGSASPTRPSPPAWRGRARRCRVSRSSGKTAASGCRSPRTSSCCSPIFAPTRTRTRSTPRRAGSSSTPRPSRTSATDDCPGHPVWIEPREWLGAPLAGRFPLHLVSNQPATRLHSQLDPSPVSARGKVAGREAATIHPDDARARGIADGDTVRLFNDRGQCLAGARVSDTVRPGVVVLPTGAWYDPAEPGEIGALDRHGNPNVLTHDLGTSRLAQATAAHSALVEVEKWGGRGAGGGSAPAAGGGGGGGRGRAMAARSNVSERARPTRRSARGHFFSASREFWLNLPKLYELRQGEAAGRRGYRPPSDAGHQPPVAGLRMGPP